MHRPIDTRVSSGGNAEETLRAETDRSQNLLSNQPILGSLVEQLEGLRWHGSPDEWRDTWRETHDATERLLRNIWEQARADMLEELSAVIR